MNNVFKKIKEEKAVLVGILILFVINVFLFWLKQGSLIVDTGREFYIPYQMLKGQILYKDIFNIYGPLSYQINALAFLILGQKITSLLILGVINSFIILFTLYFISREFLSKTFSGLITVLVMFSTVFAPDLFNANVPYSYAVVYALSSFLLSVLFLIKNVKEPKPLFVYLACFFAGASITLKYEYILYPLILAYILVFIFKLNWKELLKSFGCFAVVPVISYGVLFLQGLTIVDLYNNLLIIKKMSVCSSLKYFYSNYAGFYFNLNVFAANLKRFGFLIVIFSLLYTAIRAENKIQVKFIQYFFRILYVLTAIFLLLILSKFSLAILPILNLLLLLIFFKLIYNNKPVFILGLCAFVASMKTFFSLNVDLYGAFTLPIVILFTMVLIVVIILPLSSDEFFQDNIKKTLIIILAGFILIFAFRDYVKLPKKSHILITPKGDIYNYNAVVKSNQELIIYIIKNTSSKDKIVILPETPFVNFVTDRDSDNYYNSLIPLYFEAFGEQNVINHFKETRPEYIVLNNRDSIDYGLQYICKDYALNFCAFVAEDYNLVKNIDNKYRILVYKRKDLK